MTKWKDGFRIADCPLCGKTVRVVSFEDDTRWRYAQHIPYGGDPDNESCDYSLELLLTMPRDLNPKERE